MIRVYINWEYWECYKNGMYRTELKEKFYTKKAVFFMSNANCFGNAMQIVVNKWKNTMAHHLTNNSINKRAFLGQCACSFAINCPEYLVRVAWSQLTDEQRLNANNAAETIINKYCDKINEKQNNSIHRTLGIQMLFQWNS